jgi:hypothetical protein
MADASEMLAEQAASLRWRYQPWLEKDVVRQRPEHVVMAAEPRDGPVAEAAGSLEVRWIFAGRLEAAVAGWFGRFPARVESREDTYLLDPLLPDAVTSLDETNIARLVTAILHGSGKRPESSVYR